MSPLLPLAAVLLALAPQQAGPAPYTVAALDPRIASLEGQQVQVIGWLYGCIRDACALYADEGAKKLIGEQLKAWIAKQQYPHIPNVNIDTRNGVLLQSKQLIGHDVIITGRVTRACVDAGEAKCTDLVMVTPDKIVAAGTN